MRMLRAAYRSVERLFPGLYKARILRRARRAPLGPEYPFEGEAKVVPHLVRPGDTFFDVGANEGFYGMLLEDVVGQERTYCFEPLPWLVAQLRARLPRATVVQAALSDRAGTMEIHVPEIGGQVIGTRATLESDVVEVGQTGGRTHPVQVLTLDEYVEGQKVAAVDFLKIDVEGHELAALRGAERTIRRFRPVMMIEMEQRHHRQPLGELLAGVERDGYRGFFLDSAAATMHPLASFDVQVHQAAHLHTTRGYVPNFFFFPEERAGELLARATDALRGERARHVAAG
jgi:FkbM family methyltransferase